MEGARVVGGGGVRRSAVVVGRDAELDRMRAAVEAARAGEAACVLLVGEGGIGKTRLLAESTSLAADIGVAVLSGRPPLAASAPFSVVRDALRSWLRAHPWSSALAPYDRGLRVVLPEWPLHSTPAADLDPSEQRLLATEGVIHLVRAVADDAGGTVVVLDDLHAADPESVETVRALVAAHLVGVGVIGALRPSESTVADELVRTLGRDATTEIIEIGSLDAEAVELLVGEVLTAPPPRELVNDVLARTDGVPLLVEELVRGHVVAGTVVVADGKVTWHGGAGRVPGSIRDLVDARMDLLDPTEREIVLAGAVVADFDPAMMRAVACADDAQIAAALTAGARAGLLETSGGTVGFRHMIIRDALLDGAIPHLVDTMHRRAIDALSDATDAETLERRAGHLAAVGVCDDAAVALVAAAAQLVDDHALLGAERAARAALGLARAGSVRAAAADQLAAVLTAQGRWTDALALDDSTVLVHGDGPARRRRRIACALDAGVPDVADVALAAARTAGDDSPALTLLAGRLALVRGDAAFALECARCIVDDDSVDADTRLAGLDLEGRAHDFLGARDAARASWQRQAREAEARGRTQARLRALVQLGKVDLFAGESLERLHEAVEVAREAGSLVELAWAQENLAIALTSRGDVAAGLAIFDEAVARCRPLGLDQAAYLIVAQAMGRSFIAEQGIEELLAEAETLAPTPDLALHSASMRGDIALRAARYDDAIEWMRRSTELARAMPGVVPMDSMCWLPWALLAAGRRDHAAAALGEARAIPDLERFYTRPVIIEAAAAAFEGDAARIDAILSAVEQPMPLDVALIRTLMATIIGGDRRTVWLREALDIYDAAGATLESDRTRARLRAAGGAVPRRRRATTVGVPDALAARGVTAREAEVLQLIAEGRPNAEIASRLYLSVRTVEAHVSALLTKLGARNRSELVRYADPRTSTS